MSERLHTQYSAEDIQNYLSGRLTPLQMHAMEKAALDDVFLAEALEGYAGMQQNNWEKQLAELKQGFAQQQGAKAVSISKNRNSWWQAAAAILIVALGSSIGYYLLTKKQTAVLAKQDVKDVIVNADSLTITATDATVSTEQGNVSLNSTPAIAQNIPPKQKNTVIKDLTRNTDITSNTDSTFIYKPAAGRSDDIASAEKSEAKQAQNIQEVPAEKNAAAPAANNNAGVLSNTVNANTEYAKKSNAGYTNVFDKDKNAERDFAFKKEQQPLLNKIFNAQVVSADNSPLPFANISIKSEGFGTYADVKGNFRLLSNDSILSVEIKSAGFKPQLFNLKSTVSLNKIILTEDNTALSNATVVTAGGYKNKPSRRAALIKDSILNAEPADGWNNYYTYADNNFEIPDDILEKNIHGKVELSFDVTQQGVISNIKVDKSLCNGCDEAAIRLLQQGPQWKVKKGKKGKGKITIQF
jgi:hypothetical protein